MFCPITKRNTFKSIKRLAEFRYENEEAAEIGWLLLRDFISRYKPHDIFNADECELFCRFLPNVTICPAPLKPKKKKRDSNRFLIQRNVDGTYRYPHLCFNGARGCDHGIAYHTSKKARMTHNCFSDDYIGAERNWEVLMLIDNPSCHEKKVNSYNCIILRYYFRYIILKLNYNLKILVSLLVLRCDTGVGG